MLISNKIFLVVSLRRVAPNTSEQRSRSGLCKRVIRREATETEGLVSFISDLNCFYGAISWWPIEKENFHQSVRINISKFIKRSSKCQQYVGNKTAHSIEDYI